MWEMLMNRDGTFFLLVLRWLIGLAVLGIVAAMWRTVTYGIRVLFSPNRKAIQAVQRTIHAANRLGRDDPRVEELRGLAQRLLHETKLPDYVTSGHPGHVTETVESYFAARRDAEVETARLSER